MLLNRCRKQSTSTGVVCRTVVLWTAVAPDGKATVEDECWWCDESLLSDLAAWWGDETHEETPKNDAEKVDGALKDGLVQDSP